MNKQLTSYDYNKNKAVANSILFKVLSFIDEYAVVLLVIGLIVLAAWFNFPRNNVVPAAQSTTVVTAPPALPQFQAIPVKKAIMCTDSTNDKTVNEYIFSTKTDYTSSYHTSICGYEVTIQYVMK